MSQRRKAVQELVDKVAAELAGGEALIYDDLESRLGLSHNRVFYALTLLIREGKVKRLNATRHRFPYNRKPFFISADKLKGAG